MNLKIYFKTYFIIAIFFMMAFFGSYNSVYAGSCSSAITGNWGVAGTWGAGCTGVGGLPTTSDDVTVTSGHTVTLDIATPVVNALTISGALDTSGTNYALNAKTLTISSTGTLTANASTITLTGTGGSVFNKDASGTFTAGTSTVVVNSATDFAYASQFGSSGTGNGQFSTPFGVAIDSAGNIFVVDGGNHRVQKFDSTGAYVSQFGSSGSGNGQFSNPRGIAIDSSDNIFVVDCYNHRIQKFNSSGTYQSQFGTFGSGNSQFSYPVGIAIDSSGNMYIGDQGNSRIKKVDSSGTYLSSLATNGSGDGQVNQAYGVTIDADGNIFVLDTYNKRVQKFNSAGTYQSKFGSAGTGNGQFGSYNSGIDIDADGNIYVGDNTNFRVQKFNSSGTYVSQFGSTGTGNGQFKGVAGVVFDSSGNMYVADTATNHRVQKFSPTSIVSATTSFYNLTVSGASTKKLGGAVTVTNVMTISSGSTLSAGANSLTLSGTTGTPFVITGTFNANTGTVSYTGNYSSGNTTVPSATYYNLTVNNSSETYILGGNITASGVLTISSGTTLDASSYTITLSGTTGTPFVKTGTFLPNTGTVTYTGNNSGGNTSVVASTYNNLTINGADTYDIGSGSSFLYSRAITIDHTKVPNTSQTDFPVLVSGTYSYLATVANGGKVQNASGYDIGFYSDAGLTTKLKWETEKYTATTGEVIYWVKVPTVSTLTDTVIYMAYGNSGIVTDQSSATNVWDSNFKGVWHLPNGTTLTANDSTANANNGTVTGTSAGTGKIDGAGSFDGNDDMVSGSSGLGLNGTSTVTYSIWLKTCTQQSNKYLLSIPGGGSNNGLDLSLQGATTVTFIVRTSGGSTQKDVTQTYADSSWHNLVGIYDGSNMTIYFDGAQIGGNTAKTGNLSIVTTEFNIGGFGSGFPSGYNFNGSIDEVKVSTTARSADWIRTEYNNQNDPSTFYTMGGELPVFNYKRAITIDHTKVQNSDQTDFPVLISGTYSYLATVANGGKVQNASGYDIGFYSDAGLTTKLKWETEKYTATTGEVIYWVKIPTLSRTSDTVIYMAYGSSGVTTDQSDATNVWNSGYKGVWHLPNGTSLTALDSTTNVHNGTVTGTSAGTGKIDGGGSFDGNDYISIGTSTDYYFNGTLPYTISTWFNASSLGTTQRIVSRFNGGVLGNWNLQLTTASKLEASREISPWSIIGGTTLSTSTWYHGTFVYDGTYMRLYLNGASDAAAVASGNITANQSNLSLYFGASQVSSVPGVYFSGLLDEPRISNVARSADWVATEYNNQSSPSTFYAVGGEMTSTNTLDVLGNLTITTGTLDAVSGSNYSVNVGGNWSNSGTFTARSGLVTFNSATTATISGATTFYDLTFSNAGTKTVSSDITSTNLLTNASGSTLSLGSTTVTLSGAGLVFSNTGTITGGTSTFKLTDTSSTAKTFAGGGATFNNIWLAPGAGTGSFTITGSNTFADFKDDGTDAHSVFFTAGTTTTITSLTVAGQSGHLITLGSSLSGSPWTISDTTGTNTANYIALSDSIATGGATFNSTNSNDLGRNKGWNIGIIYDSSSRGGGSSSVEASTTVGTCTDGAQNGDETGTDTGGRCTNVGTCGDLVQNGNETGVDTGGRCTNEGSGSSSVDADQNVGTCTDGVQNGNETGTDTGGRCAGGGGQGGGSGDIGFLNKRYFLASVGTFSLKPLFRNFLQFFI